MLENVASARKHTKFENVNCSYTENSFFRFVKVAGILCDWVNVGHRIFENIIFTHCSKITKILENTFFFSIKIKSPSLNEKKKKEERKKEWKHIYMLSFCVCVCKKRNIPLFSKCYCIS